MANDFEEVGSSKEEKLKERRIPNGQENNRRETRKREIPHRLKETAAKRRNLETKQMESNLGEKKTGSLAAKTKSIDELPPEVLRFILQKVSSSNLLKCRRMNRKFMEIASGILRERADLNLHFALSEDGMFMRKICQCPDKELHRHCKESLVNGCKPDTQFTCKSLSQLVIWLNESEHFPITSFRIDDLHKFRSPEMQSFLSIWGKEIVKLSITVADDQKDSVGILRDLLVEKVPNLKILKIFFGRKELESSIGLFADSDKVTLPKLQVLSVNIRRSSQFRPIVANILKAACNLNTVICDVEAHTETVTADDLTFLESFNKLHCLRRLQINMSEETIAFWGKSTKSALKLESLVLTLESSIWKSDKLKSSATAILNQLFRSSENCMQSLALLPLGSFSLPGVFFPKMDKLKKLMLGLEQSTINATLPLLLEMAEKFPNLEDLGFYIEGTAIPFFPTSHRVKPMPSVTILRIHGDVSIAAREIVMQATPNVTTLFIREFGIPSDTNCANSVSVDFRVILNHMPKLQSLGWLIQRTRHINRLHSLDAVITGLPIEFCKKQSEKFCNKDRLSADELAFCQSQKRNSSILDLKELRHLDVNFVMNGAAYHIMNCIINSGIYGGEDEHGFAPGDLLYRTGFSKVSKFLAFDLMPNLKVAVHTYLE